MPPIKLFFTTPRPNLGGIPQKKSVKNKKKTHHETSVLALRAKQTKKFEDKTSSTLVAPSSAPSLALYKSSVLPGVVVGVAGHVFSAKQKENKVIESHKRGAFITFGVPLSPPVIFIWNGW